jgi:hypothetical protein
MNILQWGIVHPKSPNAALHNRYMIMNNNIVQKPLYIPQINRIADLNRAYVESVEMDTNPDGKERRAQFLDDQKNMRRFGYLFSGAIARHLKGSERIAAGVKIDILKTQKKLKEVEADPSRTPEKEAEITALKETISKGILRLAPKTSMGGTPTIDSVIHEDDVEDMMSVAEEDLDDEALKAAIDVKYPDPQEAEAMFQEYIDDRAKYNALKNVELPRVSTELERLQLAGVQAEDEAKNFIKSAYESSAKISEKYPERQGKLNLYEDKEADYNYAIRELKANTNKLTSKDANKVSVARRRIEELTRDKNALEMEMPILKIELDQINAKEDVKQHEYAMQRAEAADKRTRQIAREFEERKQEGEQLLKKAEELLTKGKMTQAESKKIKLVAVAPRRNISTTNKTNRRRGKSVPAVLNREKQAEEVKSTTHNHNTRFQSKVHA